MPSGGKDGEPVLTTLFFGLVTVVASAIAAVVGLMMVRRLIPFPLREPNNTPIGTIYAALYVMFGVSVGFALYLTWQQYNMARETVKSEAVAVEQVYRLAGKFSEPERSRVRELDVSYASGVLEEEWPAMRQGQQSARVEALLDELRKRVQDYEPHTDAQSGLYDESLAVLDELEANRELRILAVNEGIPYIVWVVLVSGGVLTVAFTYLFGVEPDWLHTVAVAGLAIMISLVLHVIGVLDYPFNGGVHVQPDAFEQVLKEIGGPP